MNSETRPFIQDHLKRVAPPMFPGPFMSNIHEEMYTYIHRLHIDR